jgi:hypothetical protein
MLHVTVRIHVSSIARLANFTNCPHFLDYVHEEVSELKFTVVIPSYDRPEVLCRKTLALLRKHGVLDPSILVLITPGRVPGNKETEWNRYRTSLLGNGFAGVRREIGAVGLEKQIWQGMQYVGEGNYMVCMTDDVSDIKMMRLLSRKMTIPKGPEVLTAGGLLGVFSLGWQLINDLQVGGWGVNCAHDGRSLDPRMVSCSLGLVEGNLYGIKVNLKEEMQCRLSGVLCDHETSCRMWAHGGRFVRFQMLCVVHSYRISGGYQSSFGIEQRKLLEKNCIAALITLFPDLVERRPPQKTSGIAFQPLQYKNLRSPPIHMLPPSKGANLRKYKGLRGSTSAERTAAWRKRAELKKRASLVKKRAAVARRRK